MRKTRNDSARAAPSTAVRRGTISASAAWVVMGILVVVATFVAYLPALKAQFIWNDSDYVTAPPLRSLAGLGRIWFELGATEQYYPLLHSAFWFQHQLFGDAPAGYHLVNLLLHVTATVLFALVLWAIQAGGSDAADARTAIGAWLGAALFALHPVHVASVAWVTEQKNTLSLIFYLAAALAYLRFDETRGRGHYYLALVLFVLSLLSKTATATLPAALLVVIWWRRGRLAWRTDVLPLVPWLVIGAAAGVFTSWVERHYLGAQGTAVEGAKFGLSPIGHLLLAGRAVWFYLGSLVWPFRLNFMYPRWLVDGTIWWQWSYPLAALGVIAGLWVWRTRTRAPLAVALVFVGTLFPVLGFVNLFGALYSRVWDHWQYLADLAPLGAAGIALARYASRRTALIVGGAVGVVFCVLTWQHAAEYDDNERLYRSTLARNPDCWMAHNNLGSILALQPATLAEAIEHYSAAVRLNPSTPELHYNLANALAKTPDRVAEAIAEYEVALRLDPDYVMAHDALGSVLTRIDGRLDEAIAHFRAALRITPDVADIHNNLGIALLIGEHPDQAIAQFREAAKLNPQLGQIHFNLAMALQSVGRTGEAQAEYETAKRLGIGR